MTRISILLLLIILLKQSQNVVFGSNVFNLTVSYPSSTIFPSEFEDVSSTETHIFRLRVINNNRQISIRKMECANNLLSAQNTIDYSFSDVNNQVITAANIYVLPNYIAVIYKDALLNAYRFLVDKSTLAFVSSTLLPEYYEGLYSKKFQIFFSKNINNQIKLYEGMEGAAPVYTNVMTYQGYPMEFLLACGQTKLITLFQGSKFIKIRLLENAAKIKINFATYQLIYLPNRGYQCFCLNTLQTTLFILDNLGLLVQISLLNNSIIKTKNINITNHNRCFYTHDTNQNIVFIKESNSASFSLSLISQYNLVTEVVDLFVSSDQVGYAKISRNQQYIFQTSNTQVTLRAINNHYCQALGTYLELNICKTCSDNCQSCTGINACSLCMIYYVLTLGMCAECPAATFYIAAACQNCSLQCLNCTSFTNCSLCAFGYVLNSGFCAQCPGGTFYTVLGCQSCSSYCLSCTSLSVCTQCAFGYILSLGVCSPCPAGTFYTVSGCQPCASHCLTCTSLLACTQCVVGHVLSLGICSQCLGGNYYNGSACQPCSLNCQSCTSLAICTQCFSGYGVSSGQCIQCLTGTFYTTSGCQTCSLNCSSCTGLSACTQCVIGYSLSSGECSQIKEPIEYIPIDVKQAIMLIFNNSGIIFMNRFPSSRHIFLYAFYFFGQFDDLWLYQFHQRDYGNLINTLFNSINSLQNSKWQFLDVERVNKIQNFLSINFTETQNSLNNRQAYSGPSYVRSQKSGQSLLANCLYYFTLNIVFVLITFLILRKLFQFLFNYRVSKFLRPFSFWGSVGVILLDGNMQIIFFLMFSQSQLSFQANFKDKIMATLSHLLFFFFLLFSVSCYFLYYTAYKSLSKYFLDNSKCSLNGVIAITICSTFRQLILSAIHNFLRYDYQVQLSMLFAVEILYIVTILFFYKITKAFIHSNIIWTTLLFSFMRAIFNAILYVQQRQLNNEEIMNAFEILLEYLLFTYLLVYMLGIIWNFMIVLIEGLQKALKTKASDQNPLEIKDDQEKKQQNKKGKSKLTPQMIKKIQQKLKTPNFNCKLVIPDEISNQQEQQPRNVSKSNKKPKTTKDLDNNQNRLICRETLCFKRKNNVSFQK